MPKRPFRRLPGTSNENDAFAVKNNRRPYVFNFTTPDGGTICSQGSVKPERVDELSDIFKRLQELHELDDVN